MATREFLYVEDGAAEEISIRNLAQFIAQEILHG
jgi:hypothetical protein